jgi:hypothetical protein
MQMAILNGLTLNGDVMAQFTQQQECNLEREMMTHRGQPIPDSRFLYGEDVGYSQGGWADITDAQIYKIQKTKALVRLYGEKQKYYWVPIKHLYKKKGDSNEQ